MTCRTYGKKETIFHTCYIILLTVFGVMATYSAVFALCHIHCAEDKIALCFTIFFALLILSVDFFECRAMGARLYMNDEGIGVRRFRKTKVFIKWSEIREIGTGSIPTPFGKKRRIYFCDRKLDQKEKSDLVTLKYHTVHFSHIPEEWYAKMSERLPTPIAEELKEEYVKYNEKRKVK